MRTVIAGPPGTGKTHTLIHKHLYNELIVNKIDPKKIAYITFSNAAADEARDRIKKEFPKYEFDWICTMHSMGTKNIRNRYSIKHLLILKEYQTIKLYLEEYHVQYIKLHYLF
jgi:superfamily I DNA/RNA helicase